MGLRKSQNRIDLYKLSILGVSLFLSVLFFSQEVWSQSETIPSLTPWKVIRQKSFPNYKVEILQRWTKGKWPRVDATKARIVPIEGGSVTEVTANYLTPDPQQFIVDWKGGLLDMNGDRLEDLVLLKSTGGAHCCYSYVVYSLAKPIKKLGEIEMQDCGEKIRLADLNGDGKPEIMSCEAKFTYLGDLPYSQSPFSPAIWALGPSGYERADKRFIAVYTEDINRQRALLQKGYNPTAVLQIVTDYFLIGEEAKGWETFDSFYQGQDKEKIKLQLLKKLGLKIEDAETKSSENKPKSNISDPKSTDALP